MFLYYIQMKGGKILDLEQKNAHTKELNIWINFNPFLS
jgi:hypothetical protein